MIASAFAVHLSALALVLPAVAIERITPSDVPSSEGVLLHHRPPANSCLRCGCEDCIWRPKKEHTS